MGRSTCCFIDKDVQCPYYKRVDRTRSQIICEGIDGATSSRLQFSGNNAMFEFMRQRCTTDYCLCHMCRGLNEYYEV